MNAALKPYVDGYGTLPMAPTWLKPLQDAALERVVERGFPGSRDEAWKYTSVAALEKRGFTPSIATSRLGETVLAALLIPGLESSRAVFVDGRFEPDLSVLPKGVKVLPLPRADMDMRDLFTVAAEWQNDTFVNLNTALFRDGLLLELAPAQALEKPIELLHVSTAQAGAAAHSLRFVARLGAGASACIIERHLGLEGAKSFNNVVTQVELAESTKLTHVRLQSESAQAFHVGRVLVRQAASSEYHSHNLNVGGLWTGSISIPAWKQKALWPNSTGSMPSRVASTWTTTPASITWPAVP